MSLCVLFCLVLLGDNMGWGVGRQQNVNKKIKVLEIYCDCSGIPLPCGFHFSKLNLAVCAWINTNIYHAPQWSILWCMKMSQASREDTLTRMGGDVRNTKPLRPSTVFKERVGEKSEDKASHNKDSNISSLSMWPSLHNWDWLIWQAKPWPRWVLITT